MNIYIFKLLQIAIKLLTFVFYKTDITKSSETIDSKRGVVYVCNHVSYVDTLFLLQAVDRPVRFVMYYKIYNIPVLKHLFKALGAIPIAGYREDKEIFTKAFEEIEKTLLSGHSIFIFPEGALTYDGNMVSFKRGVERIIEKTPTKVIPIGLSGLWGSLFSRHKDKTKHVRLNRKVRVIVGEAIPHELANRGYLQAKVKELIVNP